VVDEYTLCQNTGDAESILRSHWDSWVSLGDFQKIAANGFNLVRIPIGYWAFQKYEQDPYIQGAADYLDTAIGWARQTGLKIWIDLHGMLCMCVCVIWMGTDGGLQAHHALRMGTTTQASSPRLQAGRRAILSTPRLA